MSQKSNDIEELTEGIFPIKFKVVDQYQQKDPSLNTKYKMCTYKKDLFVEELLYILTL